MKARWVWSIWAHVALCLMIAMELLFIGGAIVFIIPKFREMVMTDAIRVGTGGEGVVIWGVNFLNTVVGIADQWPWLLLAVIIGWIIFERVIRSENKTLIRLAKLGSVAAFLLVVALLTAAALVLPLIIEFPDLRNISPALAIHNTQRRLDTDITRLQEDITRGDHYQVEFRARDASQMLTRLSDVSAMLETSTPTTQPGALQARYDRARETLEEIRIAAAGGDYDRVRSALKTFQETYATLRVSTSQPAPRTP